MLLRTLILIILTSHFFWLSPCLASSDISVSLRLDRKEATLQDTVHLVISVSGASKNIGRPSVKGLDNFYVTPAGTSSRVEIVNGKMNAGIDFNYSIQAKSKGIFKIGPADVTYKSRVYSSNTETLKIFKPAKSSGVERGPLFLSAALSSKRLYVEDHAIYTLKLHRKGRVSDISLSLPDVEDITLKQLTKPIEYESVYNGKEYQILEVRYALIPSKEGIYGIKPSRMNMTVYQAGRRSRRSLFDDPFFSFSSGRPVTVTSEPLEIEVLPLPDKNRPNNFTGLVGNYKIESELEPTTVNARESTTLTVTISGRGNVNRLPELKLSQMPQAKIYADQPVLEVKTEASGMHGTKTMKWAIVPEKEGSYQIPILSASYFDTKVHEYKTIETSPLSLLVLPGEKLEISIAEKKSEKNIRNGHEKKEVEELGRDILPVHSSVQNLEAGGEVQVGSPVSWILLFGPFFIYLTAFLGLRFTKKSDRTVAILKAKKAAKEFERRCSKKEIHSAQLVNMIKEYFCERFDLAIGSLTPKEAAKILESNGVTYETARSLTDVLKNLENIIYTGKGDETINVDQALVNIIKQIEKEIR